MTIAAPLAAPLADVVAEPVDTTRVLGRAATLVDRLALPSSLVAPLSRAVLSGGVVESEDDDLDQALRAGIVMAAGGGLVLDPWCRTFLQGEDAVSVEVHALTVPVPVMPGPTAEQVLRVLTERSPLVELVAAEEQLAPASAAWALQQLGYTPMLVTLSDVGVDVDHVVSRVFLEARVLGLAPVFRAGAELAGNRGFLGRLQGQGWPTVLVVDRRARTFTPREPFATLAVAPTAPVTRAQAWRDLLGRSGEGEESVDAGADGLEALETLPLSVTEMHETYERAATSAVADGRAVVPADLVEHGREVLVDGASRLADVRTTEVGRDELVFGDALQDDLTSFSQAAVSLLGRPVAGRGGLRALFSGPSGTGKTAAAESMAAVLGVPALFVDVSRVVDKYIGETEKNLDRVFAESQRSNAILVFDEGESLFGSRSPSSGNAGSEAANRQIAYLLARLEQHPGIVIVASNYPGAIDKAFTRRFHFLLTFQVPTPEQRAEVWKGLAQRHGLGDSLDLTALAAYELSGGNIANICFLAALLAPSREEPVQDLVADLTRREYARLGKRLA